MTAESARAGSGARAVILDRVRAALADKPATPPVRRTYRRAGTADGPTLVELLTDRLLDYKAQVRTATATTLSAVIAEALAARGVGSVAVPAGMQPGWLADLGSVVLHADTPQTPLTASALDAIDATLTASALAIAETGTIVLDGEAGQGRRILSLVPDYHLCVVEAAAIVATVPEALALLDATRAQTWISGPSATSDIELQRVEGVHGPRTLEVILVVEAD